MLIDLLEYSKILLERIGIPVLFLAPPNENLLNMDLGFYGRILEQFEYKVLFENLKTILSPEKLVYLKIFEYLNYAVFSFPPELKTEYPYDCCLAGPVLFEPLTPADFHKILDTYEISYDCYQDIQEYYNRLTVIPSEDIWNNVTLLFAETLYGKKVETVHAEAWKVTGFLNFPESSYTIPSLLEIAPNMIEHRYEAEDKYLKVVIAGDIKSALPLYQAYRRFRLMPRSSDPLRNLKMQLTVINTLTRKAVQSACIHPLHIDNLSSQLAIQIEDASSLQQLERLELTMVRKYCMLVNNYSRRNHSAMVQFCLDYIDFHYSENLTLALMAEKCFVTTNYLSGLFRKEMGMGMTNYIHDTRIHQALILLNTTTLPIHEISARCGYSDINYFTRVFKKRKGMTPREYRAMIQ